MSKIIFNSDDVSSNSLKNIVTTTLPSSSSSIDSNSPTQSLQEIASILLKIHDYYLKDSYDRDILPCLMGFIYDFGLNKVVSLLDVERLKKQKLGNNKRYMGYEDFYGWITLLASFLYGESTDKNGKKSLNYFLIHDIFPFYNNWTTMKHYSISKIQSSILLFTQRSLDIFSSFSEYFLLFYHEIISNFTPYNPSTNKTIWQSICEYNEGNLELNLLCSYLKKSSGLCPDYVNEEELESLALLCCEDTSDCLSFSSFLYYLELLSEKLSGDQFDCVDLIQANQNYMLLLLTILLPNQFYISFQHFFENLSLIRNNNSNYSSVIKLSKSEKVFNIFWWLKSSGIIHFFESNQSTHNVLNENNYLNEGDQDEEEKEEEELNLTFNDSFRETHYPETLKDRKKEIVREKDEENILSSPSWLTLYSLAEEISLVLPDQLNFQGIKTKKKLEVSSVLISTMLKKLIKFFNFSLKKLKQNIINPTFFLNFYNENKNNYYLFFLVFFFPSVLFSKVGFKKSTNDEEILIDRKINIKDYTLHFLGENSFLPTYKVPSTPFYYLYSKYTYKLWLFSYENLFNSLSRLFLSPSLTNSVTSTSPSPSASIPNIHIFYQFLNVSSFVSLSLIEFKTILKNSLNILTSFADQAHFDKTILDLYGDELTISTSMATKKKSSEKSQKYEMKLNLIQIIEILYTYIYNYLIKVYPNESEENFCRILFDFFYDFITLNESSNVLLSKLKGEKEEDRERENEMTIEKKPLYVSTNPDLPPTNSSFTFSIQTPSGAPRSSFLSNLENSINSSNSNLQSLPTPSSSIPSLSSTPKGSSLSSKGSSQPPQEEYSGLSKYGLFDLTKTLNNAPENAIDNSSSSNTSSNSSNINNQSSTSPIDTTQEVSPLSSSSTGEYVRGSRYAELLAASKAILVDSTSEKSIKSEENIKDKKKQEENSIPKTLENTEEKLEDSSFSSSSSTEHKNSLEEILKLLIHYPLSSYHLSPWSIGAIFSEEKEKLKIYKDKSITDEQSKDEEAGNENLFLLSFLKTFSDQYSINVNKFNEFFSYFYSSRSHFVLPGSVGDSIDLNSTQKNTIKLRYIALTGAEKNDEKNGSPNVLDYLMTLGVLKLLNLNEDLLKWEFSKCFSIFQNFYHILGGVSSSGTSVYLPSSPFISENTMNSFHGTLTIPFISALNWSMYWSKIIQFYSQKYQEICLNKDEKTNKNDNFPANLINSQWSESDALYQLHLTLCLSAENTNSLTYSTFVIYMIRCFTLHLFRSTSPPSTEKFLNAIKSMLKLMAQELTTSQNTLQLLLLSPLFSKSKEKFNEDEQKDEKREKLPDTESESDSTLILSILSDCIQHYKQQSKGFITSPPQSSLILPEFSSFSPTESFSFNLPPRPPPLFWDAPRFVNFCIKLGLLSMSNFSLDEAWNSFGIFLYRQFLHLSLQNKNLPQNLLNYLRDGHVPPHPCQINNNTLYELVASLYLLNTFTIQNKSRASLERENHVLVLPLSSFQFHNLRNIIKSNLLPPLISSTSYFHSAQVLFEVSLSQNGQSREDEIFNTFSPKEIQDLKNILPCFDDFSLFFEDILRFGGSSCLQYFSEVHNFIKMTYFYLYEKTIHFKSNSNSTFAISSSLNEVLLSFTSQALSLQGIISIEEVLTLSRLILQPRIRSDPNCFITEERLGNSVYLTLSEFEQLLLLVSFACWVKLEKEKALKKNEIFSMDDSSSTFISIKDDYIKHIEKIKKKNEEEKLQKREGSDSRKKASWGINFLAPYIQYLQKFLNFPVSLLNTFKQNGGLNCPKNYLILKSLVDGNSNQNDKKEKELLRTYSNSSLSTISTSSSSYSSNLPPPPSNTKRGSLKGTDSSASSFSSKLSPSPRPSTSNLPPSLTALITSTPSLPPPTISPSPRSTPKSTAASINETREILWPLFATYCSCGDSLEPGKLSGPNLFALLSKLRGALHNSVKLSEVGLFLHGIHQRSFPPSYFQNNNELKNSTSFSSTFSIPSLKNNSRARSSLSSFSLPTPTSSSSSSTSSSTSSSSLFFDGCPSLTFEDFLIFLFIFSHAHHPSYSNLLSNVGNILKEATLHSPNSKSQKPTGLVNFLSDSESKSSEFVARTPRTTTQLWVKQWQEIMKNSSFFNSYLKSTLLPILNCNKSIIACPDTARLRDKYSGIFSLEILNAVSESEGDLLQYYENVLKSVKEVKGRKEESPEVVVLLKALKSLMLLPKIINEEEVLKLVKDLSPPSNTPSPSNTNSPNSSVTSLPSQSFSPTSTPLPLLFCQWQWVLCVVAFHAVDKAVSESPVPTPIEVYLLIIFNFY